VREEARLMKEELRRLKLDEEQEASENKAQKGDVEAPSKPWYKFW